MGTLRPSKSTDKTTRENGLLGFTLIEVLVVISIVGILTTILIGYSRQSGRNLALTSSQAKLLSLVSRAKFLSIETFFDQLDNPSGDMRICAYGVHVDEESNEVFIFQDRMDLSISDCDSSNNIFDSQYDLRMTGELDELKLDGRVLEVRESPATTLGNIVFIPPDPDVVINGSPGTTEGVIEIGIVEDVYSYTVRVDKSGQVKSN